MKIRFFCKNLENLGYIFRENVCVKEKMQKLCNMHKKQRRKVLKILHDKNWTGIVIFVNVWYNAKAWCAMKQEVAVVRTLTAGNSCGVCPINRATEFQRHLNVCWFCRNLTCRCWCGVKIPIFISRGLKHTERCSEIRPHIKTHTYAKAVCESEKEAT